MLPDEERSLCVNSRYSILPRQSATLPRRSCGLVCYRKGQLEMQST